jgi:hypothetical protein
MAARTKAARAGHLRYRTDLAAPARGGGSLHRELGVGVKVRKDTMRHYSASQLLAGGIDLRNTAARLGHGGGGATTLRHYADPVSEVDRRAATYLAQLTAPATSVMAAPQAELHPKKQ